MRAAYVFIGSLLATVALCGCAAISHQSRSLDISLRNDSGFPLDWMNVQWEGPTLIGGSMPAGASKTTMDVLPPSSDVAAVTFVEDRSRARHSIRLNVSRLKGLAPGRHKVTIAVKSLTQAELLIDE